MNKHENHEDLVKGLYKQLEPIFKSSDQAIYLYLDDVHKVCNEKLSSLLGYSSPSAWAAVDDPFPKFVAEESRNALVDAYQNAIERYVASTLKIVWKKKDGSKVSKTVVMVPIIYQGYSMALHFIS